MKIHIICGTIAMTLLTGCGSPGAGQRVTLDTLATGGGGAAAYYASGKDPAITTAGAVGGFVVSEGLQSMAATGRKKSYNTGLEEGRAIGQQQVLQGLWEQSNGLPPKSLNTMRYSTVRKVQVPSRVQNGVIYDEHVTTSEVDGSNKREKILTNQPSNSESSTPPHYEYFQNDK